MQLAPREFNDVFGAVQEYGRLEYRAGMAHGQQARPVLQEAYGALAALRELLAVATAAPSAYRAGTPGLAEPEYLVSDPRADGPGDARADRGGDNRADRRDYRDELRGDYRDELRGDYRDELRGDYRADHRAAARAQVLANRDLGGGAGDLARECLAWISSYRADLDPNVYRECVLGVLDGYRELTSAVNPWVTADSVPRQR